MMRFSPLTRIALAGAALAVLASCVREDEPGMRARLEAWFSLGETRYFAAEVGCAAGLFGLVDDSVGAAMPVTASVAEMLRVLDRRGRAALDDPAQPPDAALVALANADRATGMAMRRAALEARECLSDGAQETLRTGLTSAAALLAWDAESGTVIVIDVPRGVLVAVMGAA